MTIASDRNRDPGKLSVNAKKMLELKSEVMQEWGNRLRSTVKEAQTLPLPILINTFPLLYENLAQAISPDYPRNSGQESTTVPAEHGGERARLTHYNAQAVISEYQLLRWTIFDILRLHAVQLDNQEFFLINNSIDGYIKEAVNAFSLAQSLLRERFVAALTHDLRNPLAAASMATELISHADSLDKAQELAQGIQSQLDRMDNMIRELLDAILFQSGERLKLHFDHFDIMEVTQEVCRHFNTLHGSRIDLGGDAVKGCWDREALKRAIENLVGNAVKYSTPSSPISVRIATEYERMMLSVHNHGEPIPSDQSEAIFQVFRRAESARGSGSQGWGIGLPYVRTVAESHGGSVGVDSSTDRGTTFSIDIPLDARPYQEAPILSAK